MWSGFDASSIPEAKNQFPEVHSASRHHSTKLYHRTPQNPSQPQVASVTRKELPKPLREVLGGCPHFCIFFKAKS